jgi:hypothetical protein
MSDKLKEVEHQAITAPLEIVQKKADPNVDSIE